MANCGGIISEVNKYVILNSSDCQRCTEAFDNVRDFLLYEMRENLLFKRLYRNFQLAGNNGDDLKVSKSNEFNLVIEFELPFDLYLEPHYTAPGHAYIEILHKNQLTEQQHNTYMDLVRLKVINEFDYLQPNQLRYWITNIIDRILNRYPDKRFRYNNHSYMFKYREQGPTYIFEIHDDNFRGLSFSIDFVPAIILRSRHVIDCVTRPLPMGITCHAIPKPLVNKYTNPFEQIYLKSQNSSGSLHPAARQTECVTQLLPMGIGCSVIPKPSEQIYLKPQNTSQQLYPAARQTFGPVKKIWLISVNSAERELIGDKNNLKPCVRLLKKWRNKQNLQNLKSYYIKTIFLWMIEKNDDTYWSRPIIEILIDAIITLSVVMENRKLDYYWNDKYNMIRNLTAAQCSDIYNHLNNVLKKIQNFKDTKPQRLFELFLSEEELKSVKYH